MRQIDRSLHRWRAEFGWAKRWIRSWAKSKMQNHSDSSRADAGFTLLEMLVALALVVILAAIVAPGWLGLHTANLLNSAQDGAFQAIRQTQIRAISTKQTWQTGFRESGSQVEWAMFTVGGGSTAIWQPLTSGVQIAHSETTLSQENNIYIVEFNHKGYVTPPYGRVSFASSRGDKQRRCVFVSTLMGVLRKASNQECY
jgi:prepilin-type N-terminal cleavage/methylation domain-containing protein